MPRSRRSRSRSRSPPRRGRRGRSRSRSRSPPRSARPAPLLLDAQGRQVDAQGNLVAPVAAPPRSAINRELEAGAAGKGKGAAKPKAKVNPYLSAGAAPAAADEPAPGFDPRLGRAGPRRRGPRAIEFVEPGTFVRMAEQQREKAAGALKAGYASGRNKKAYAVQSAARREEAALAAAEPEAEAAAEPAAVPHRAPQPVPPIEPWDAAFLPKEKRAEYQQSRGKSGFEGVELSLGNSRTAELVQHPVPVQPLGGPREHQAAVKLMLTKRERQRLRRQNRAERLRQEQDLVMLGLKPKPEPKLKLSNMMAVLGNDAVLDPSAIERKVRRQVEARRKTHEEENEARKLTAEQRRAKKKSKLAEDVSREVQVAVFVVKDVSDGKAAFKLDMNAQQYNLSGVVVACEAAPAALIVVEGGPRGVRRYTRLVLHRVDWQAGRKEDRLAAAESAADMSADTSADMEVDFEVGAGSDEARLVWRGTVLKRQFSGFRFHYPQTMAAARRLLDQRGAAHYLDMVGTAATIS